jgi:TolB protein
MRRVAYVGLIAVLGSVLGAPPASATFPGSNGKIAFGAERKSSDQIGVMEADGSGRTLLTSTPNASNDDPAWSADGSQIAFASRGLRRYALPKLRTMNADGTGRTLVVTLSHKWFLLGHPSWSPDGSKIVFWGFPSGLPSPDEFPDTIFTVNADGTGLHRLTPKSQSGSGDADPDWSPDGTTIAFSTQTNTGAMIATMDADGSNRQLLRAGYSPSWSPDGSKLAFLNYRNGEFDVFVMNADGTGLNAVTNTPNNEYSPTFSPDGTKIAFSRAQSGQKDVWIVTVPGGVFTRITNTPNRNEVGLSWQAT